MAAVCIFFSLIVVYLQETGKQLQYLQYRYISKCTYRNKTRNNGSKKKRNRQNRAKGDKNKEEKVLTIHKFKPFLLLI